MEKTIIEMNVDIQNPKNPYPNSKLKSNPKGININNKIREQIKFISECFVFL